MVSMVPIRNTYKNKTKLIIKILQANLRASDSPGIIIHITQDQFFQHILYKNKCATVHDWHELDVS